ncbi:MAG: LLM class flavin-dependent oxidoreductase [Chloroflexi bacterium]|nr:LLM class flavin-dependent oxidoreductase [Chloroflexota bacterium]
MTGLPVRFGIYVNNRAAVFLGGAFTLANLLESAKLAEELGFDFVSVGDSILAKPRYMPIPVLSAIAAQTSRVELATGILQPHMRNPVLLAKDWTTLDALSGGRSVFTVGLGTGDVRMVEREYQLVGLDKSRRGRAFEEAIEIVKRLWNEHEVTFHGSVFDVEGVTLGFEPERKPHPPVVLACGGYVAKQAGHGPNDFHNEKIAGTFVGPWDRVARLGDGWMTGIVEPDEYAGALATIKQIADRQYGRRLGAEFRTVLNCWINVNDDIQKARAESVDVLQRYHQLPMDDETVERWVFYGPPDRIAARIERYVEAGVNAFQWVIAAEDQPAQIRAIAESVRPLVRQAQRSGVPA